MKIIHFLAVPFTGLGLYNGFRGNRWLKNRIQIFKQFVIPSLQFQTDKNFVLWISWRREEKSNPIVKEFIEYLNTITDFKSVHTFNGVCFYDDKYEDEVARDRLLTSLHGSIGELLDTIGEVDFVYMTIQPSDDVYSRYFVAGVHKMFEQVPQLQAFGFSRGYIMNYQTKEVKEYNPTTNPPFYTIKFTREVFTNPNQHAQYTALKRDVGKYKAGTPLPSHEYVGDCLYYGAIKERGFIVGCHGENISTHFNIPFAGEIVSPEILKGFGLYDIPPLKIRFNLWKKILKVLPHKAQRKLRYWFGEKIYQKLYEFTRS